MLHIFLKNALNQSVIYLGRPKHILWDMDAWTVNTCCGCFCIILIYHWNTIQIHLFWSYKQDK